MIPVPSLHNITIAVLHENVSFTLRYFLSARSVAFAYRMWRCCTYRVVGIVSGCDSESRGGNEAVTWEVVVRGTTRRRILMGSAFLASLTTVASFSSDRGMYVVFKSL